MSYEPLKRMLRYSVELDHGALVPLYFINKEAAGFKLVHMAVADLPFDALRFWPLHRKAITETDGRNGGRS